MDEEKRQGNKNDPNSKSKNNSPQPASDSQIAPKIETEDSNGHDSNRYDKDNPSQNGWRIKHIIKQTKITDWIMAVATVLILVCTGIYTNYARKQWQVMSGQLKQMKGSSDQTDEIIKETKKLANNAVTQAINTTRLAEAAKSQVKQIETLVKTASQANTINRDSFEATQRPWVKVDVAIGGPIKFESGNMYITLKFDLYNTGHTPARYTWPEWRIYSARINSPNDLIEKQSTLCADFIRPNSQNTPGFTLFPDEKKTVLITAMMANPEMIADMEYYPRSTYVKFPNVSPIILGCVDYQTASRQEHHQTGFAYEVWAAGPGEIEISGNFVPVPIDNETIPADRLSLNPMTVQGLTFFAN